MQSKLPFKPLITKTTLNIWTWNINCILNKIKLVNDLLLKHDIDILLITETKIQEENISFKNYTCLWNNNQLDNYHGIVFIYKSHFNISVLNNILPFNSIFDISPSRNEDIIYQYLSYIDNDILECHYLEGRILVLKLEINDKLIILVGTYVPNSGVNKNHPLKRLAYRTLSWDKDLYHYLTLLNHEYKNVIWLGDLNVVIHCHDTHDIKSNIAGTTMEERSNIKAFMVDWIDTWDIKNKIKNCVLRSTWVYKPLRLDYVICSKNLKNNIISSLIDQTFFGSDHYPIGTQFCI